MELPKDIEVQTAGIMTAWVQEPGIMRGICLKNIPCSKENLEKTVALWKKLAGDQKICFLIDITHVLPPDKEAREYAEIQQNAIIKAYAMITRSALGRMVANVFFSLKPPPYPIKLFSNEKDARNWLTQYL